MEREIGVKVRLVFKVDIPDTVKTPENVLAEHLLNKLSLDVKWAEIKKRELVKE